VPQLCGWTTGQLTETPLQTPAGVPCPSAQLGGLQTRVLLIASFGQFALEPVQVSASSQTPAAARHTVPALPGVFWQPVAFTHVSTVQTFPSSQFGAAPPAQLPLVQTSFVVQASPSSHPRALFL